MAHNLYGYDGGFVILACGDEWRSVCEQTMDQIISMLHSLNSGPPLVGMDYIK